MVKPENFSVIVVITLQKVSFNISLLSVHGSLFVFARVSLCMCDFQRKTSHSVTLQKSTSISPIVKGAGETVWSARVRPNRFGFMHEMKRGMRSLHRVTFSQSVFLSFCLFFFSFISFFVYFFCIQNNGYYIRTGSYLGPRRRGAGRCGTRQLEAKRCG